MRRGEYRRPKTDDVPKAPVGPVVGGSEPAIWRCRFVRRSDPTLLLVLVVIAAGTFLAYVFGFRLLTYMGASDGSEGHFARVRDGEWLILGFWDNTPGPGKWRAALIVCQDVPASVDLSGSLFGRAERTDGVGPWQTFEVEGQPTMNVAWGQKARWKWGDTAPMESRELTDDELRTIITSDWDQENAPDLLRTFVGRTPSSQAAPQDAGR